MVLLSQWSLTTTLQEWLDFVHQIVSDWKAHTSSTQELDGGKAWACTVVYTLALVAQRNAGDSGATHIGKTLCSIVSDWIPHWRDRAGTLQGK